MYRPFAILLALGLLGATVGCHHTHGVCDCEVPFGHEPPLLTHTAAPPQPLRPEPIQAMPKPAEETAAAPATDTPR